MSKGLTLLEILTAISILATLAALLFPVYQRLMKRVYVTSCANQLRQIGLAFRMYAQDYGKDDPFSILVSGEWAKIFGGMRDGVLCIICDGKGIIRHIERYPVLRFSPYWEEEVADWRPKLHRAVKKVLDEFFPKGQRR